MGGTDLKLLWCLESRPIFLNVAIILINNAEWQRYEGISDCDTLLPPISTNYHLGSSTGPSTVAPQAWDYGFESIVGTLFSMLTFPYSSLFLSCSLVLCTHTGEQAHTHIMHTRTCTHAHHHHLHHPQPTTTSQSLTGPCPCATAFGCRILLLLVPKTVLPLCNLRW